MSGKQKILLGILLVGILAVIILTWGSIGSSVMTLALLLTIGFLFMRKLLMERSDEDYWLED